MTLSDSAVQVGAVLVEAVISDLDLPDTATTSCCMSHLISSAAYKRGQDEYQSGIAKFHSVLNGNASTND
jgi:hypothetical protein